MERIAVVAVYEVLLELVGRLCAGCRCGCVSVLTPFVAGGAFLCLLGFGFPYLCSLLHQQLLADVEHVAAFLYIFAAQDLVRDYSNALYNIPDESGAAYGVFAHLVKQQVGLEFYEIDLVTLDVLLHLLGRVALCVAVGVLALGQQHYVYVHALLKQHVDTAYRCLYSGLVAVVQQGYVAGEAVDELYLSCCE